MAWVFAFAVVVAVGPEPLRGQSLLSAGGFGIPVEGLGARSRGMGSMGMALPGAVLVPGDPASARGIQLPMVTGTYQPTWTTYRFQGAEQDVTASRFPHLGIAYPVRSVGGVATLTLSGVLDQNWEATEESTLTLGSGETLDIVDRFRSEGGVSVIRLGWAHNVTETLGVAASVGSHLGSIRRSMIRTFEGEGVGGGLPSFREGQEWRWTGPTAVVGASWDPSDLVRLAGSVTWSGALHAEPTLGEGGRARDIDLPVEYRFGAGGSLSPRLAINAGMSYADWSEASDDLTDGSGIGDIWSYGGGLEWEGPQMLGRTFPLRVGGRHSDLPFRFRGAEPTEDVVTFGIGMNLVGSPESPLAALDVAYERGSREAGSFSESFGRATFTIRVAGN